MKYRFLVNTSAMFHDTYSIEYKQWWESPAPMIHYINIPTRTHKDEALLLLSLGLGKQEIEEHFNIGK